MKPRYLLLALALTSAVLYSSSLPLWNGFDEPFHYSYIETLVLEHHFPQLGRTLITREIRESLALTPVSRLVKELAPDSTSIEQWTQLPEGEKLRRRIESDGLSPNLRGQPSDPLNYESQQAPLGYVLLAPFDALLATVTLPGRILLLRLLASGASAVLLYFGALRLCEGLSLGPAWVTAALFCAFLTQMLWASVAHIGNDALAIPLTVLFLGSLVRVARSAGRRRLEFLMLSLLLALGLVTKAYFLTFVPVWLALFLNKRIRATLPRRDIAISFSMPVIIAGPWYGRNLALYGSLSGTQESVSGVGLRQAFTAVPHINWLSSCAKFALWSLWTGDWSFISFSKVTLSIEAVVIVIGLGMFLRRQRALGEAGSWLTAALLCFCGGLVYQTCITWVSSRGVSQFAEPWYGQGVLVCLWVIAFQGFARSGLVGRVAAGLSCLLAAWIGLATYLFKLPMFYALGITRSTPRSVLAFWSGHPSRQLALVLPGPVWVFYLALAVFVVLVLAIEVICMGELIRQSRLMGTTRVGDQRSAREAI